jgi:very-short-patch-repair endonuclease
MGDILTPIPSPLRKEGRSPYADSGIMRRKIAEYDQFRDGEKVNSGLQILRIKNEELLNIDEILKKIET